MRKIYMESVKNDIWDSDYGLPNISFISYVSGNPDWTIAPVKHTKWCEVLYINKGKAYYTIDTKTYTASKGDILILNAGVVHAAYSDPEDPVGESGDLINSCFRLIMDSCTNVSKNTYNICQHAICTILAFIDDRIGELPEAGEESQENSLAKEIIHYIDNYYKLPLTLERLAREFFSARITSVISLRQR